MRNVLLTVTDIPIVQVGGTKESFKSKLANEQKDNNQ